MVLNCLHLVSCALTPQTPAHSPPPPQTLTSALIQDHSEAAGVVCLLLYDDSDEVKTLSFHPKVKLKDKLSVNHEEFG